MWAAQYIKGEGRSWRAIHLRTNKSNDGLVVNHLHVTCSEKNSFVKNIAVIQQLNAGVWDLQSASKQSASGYDSYTRGSAAHVCVCVRTKPRARLLVRLDAFALTLLRHKRHVDAFQCMKRIKLCSLFDAFNRHSLK